MIKGLHTSLFCPKKFLNLLHPILRHLHRRVRRKAAPVHRPQVALIQEDDASLVRFASDAAPCALQAPVECRKHISIIPAAPEPCVIVFDELFCLKVRLSKRKADHDDAFEKIAGKIDAFGKIALYRAKQDSARFHVALEFIKQFCLLPCRHLWLF